MKKIISLITFFIFITSLLSPGAYAYHSQENGADKIETSEKKIENEEQNEAKKTEKALSNAEKKKKIKGKIHNALDHRFDALAKLPVERQRTIYERLLDWVNVMLENDDRIKNINQIITLEILKEIIEFRLELLDNPDADEDDAGTGSETGTGTTN